MWKATLNHVVASYLPLHAQKNVKQVCVAVDGIPYPRGRAGGTQQIICWEALPQVPTPYLFIYHFWWERYPYHYIPSIDNNGTPFTY